MEALITGVQFCGIASPANTDHNGLHGNSLPERGTFFRLQVYERAGISSVEVYEMIGKSVIWVCEKFQKGGLKDTFYGCQNVEN